MSFTKNYLVINFESIYYGKVLKYLERVLDKSGYKATFLYCDGSFSKCITRLNKGESISTCDKCKNSQIITMEKGNHLKLNEFFYLKKYNQKLPATIQEEINNIALFDLIMKFKLSKSEIVKKDVYKIRVTELTSYYFNLCQIFESNEFDFILYVNGNYSTNAISRLVATQKKIASYSIELHPIQNYGLRAIRIITNRWSLTHDFLTPHDFKYFNPIFVMFFLSYLRRRILGFSPVTYTLKSKIESSQLNLQHDLCKLFVNYEMVYSIFLSSSEEIAAHFVSYDHNLNHLLDYQENLIRLLLERAEKYPHILYIIRAHPRMATTQANNYVSEEWIKIEEIFKLSEIPKNVKIIFPENRLDSYWLISQSDCIFTTWSTLGLESLFLGVPIIQLVQSIKIWPIFSLSDQPKSEDAALMLLFRKHDFGISKVENLAGWISQEMGNRWHFTSVFFTERINRVRGIERLNSFFHYFLYFIHNLFNSSFALLFTDKIMKKNSKIGEVIFKKFCKKQILHFRSKIIKSLK